ncbi:MAG: Mth938-like domain-containing protein [Piscinibacter sp.]|uniref:Mth938-like domain-containing protein n=1 Tax=Piscinibacter sp. TaxID=1903157 RepID=UPI003D0DE131
MKMQADRPEGSNAITRHAPEGVIVAGVEHRSSVLVPWKGEVLPWAVTGFEALDESSFEPLLALSPELVIFGSGSRLRFPHPALLKALMARRIGFETMDTPAACRTYNVLLAEGRAVVAALIFERGG